MTIQNEMEYQAMLEAAFSTVITIRSVAHKKQRYPTVGDWYATPNRTGSKEIFEGQALIINVSEELPRKEQFLVAIHELIEAFLCECAGVPQEAVDKFDMQFNNDFGIEPGDDSSAPYYRQHQIASGIERMLAAEVGVDWLEYGRHVDGL